MKIRKSELRKKFVIYKRFGKMQNKDSICHNYFFRNIYGTGVDTASVDYGQSKTFKTHQVFGANNIWGLENLNNVNKLPPKGKNKSFIGLTLPTLVMADHISSRCSHVVRDFESEAKTR